MPPSAPRLIRDQCKEAGVPFHFKQWGVWCPHDDIPEQTLRTIDLANRHTFQKHGTHYYKFKKEKSGNWLDNEQHLAMPFEEMMS